MVAWRYGISLLVLKNISLVRCFHSNRNFVFLRGLVIFPIYPILNELVKLFQGYCKIYLQMLIRSLASLIPFLGSRHNSRWDHVGSISACPTSHNTTTGSRGSGHFFR